MVTKKHGGKREGAGRKPSPFPARLVRIRCTDEEYEHIKKLSPRERAAHLSRESRVEALKERLRLVLRDAYVHKERHLTDDDLVAFETFIQNHASH